MGVLESATKLYVQGIEQGDYKRAIDTYAVPEYKQHSTGVKTGAEGFKEFFEDFTNRFPERKFKIIHSFEQGNLAFLFVLQNLNGKDSWLTMDIFEANESEKIVEHWDIIEPYEKVIGNFEIENNTEDLETIIVESKEELNKLIPNSKSNYNYQDVKIYKTVRFENYVANLVGFNDNEDYAAIQLFKFKHNKVVDYWEVVEPIVPLDIAKNSGKF